MRWLIVLAALVQACGPGRARPIPPRTPTPPLEASFFEAHDEAVPKMRVHLIDVGQGAATLVEFSCAAILIDTGGEENRRYDSTRSLITYLRAFFDSRPDLNNTLALLVLTHPHIDHTRGAPVVLGEFTVQHLVTDGLTDSSGGKQQRAAISAAKAKGIPVEAIRASAVPAGGLTDAVIDPVACPDGDPDIRVLWGAVEKSIHWDQKELDNRNNHSVATRIALGKSSILITGDLEDTGIRALLAKHAGTPAIHADVYEVGHHGSYNGTTKELLSALGARLALIACGPFDRKSTWTAWQYGHPRAVTVSLLEKALAGAPPVPARVVPIAGGVKSFQGWELTAPIYTTAWDSDVIVTMFADGRIAVKTRQAGATPVAPVADKH